MVLEALDDQIRMAHQEVQAHFAGLADLERQCGELAHGTAEFGQVQEQILTATAQTQVTLAMFATLEGARRQYLQDWIAAVQQRSQAAPLRDEQQ